MGIPRWLQSWRKSRPTWIGAVTRAAVAGAGLEEIVRLAAQQLREAAQADRAGIWLVQEDDPQQIEGVVVEAGREHGLSEWERLDRSMPFLEMLLASAETVVVDLKKVPQAAALSPLVRMRTAAWVPIHYNEKALGVGLVAYSFSRLLAAPEALRELADELAVVVSERRAQARLRRVEAELFSIFDSGESGLLLLDTSGRVRHANARFAELMGLGGGSDQRLPPSLATLDALAEALDGSLVSAHHGDWPHPGRSFADVWRDLRGRDAHAQAHTDDLELLRPTRRTLERHARPVKDAQDRLIGWLEVFRDVTQQRQLGKQLVQTKRLAALGQLISGIAHELNNPLTSIVGYAQLLLGRPGGGERLADLQRVYQEAERARRIVGNLLLYAREAKPETRPVRLNEIVEQTLALRSYELKTESIALELLLAPNLPLVLGDPHQIQQLLLNLVVNAEQAILEGHAEESGRRLRGRIQVRTRMQSGSRVVLEVADDGPGMAPEIEPRIFDPFFTTKPMGQGTGLGLSIACGIVRDHGGEIYLGRERPREFNTGATLVVELPALAGDEAALREPGERPVAVMLPRPARPGHAGARARRSFHVLVVEDEPTVAQLVADVLSEEGHRLETVLSSREGLARALRDHYDLVICDLRMPHLDGRGFYEALVREGVAERTRLMFITGDTLSPRTLSFLEKYDLPYLAKPFLVEELKEIVNRVLDASVRSAEQDGGRRAGPRSGSIPEPATNGARKGPAAQDAESRREAMRKR